MVETHITQLIMARVGSVHHFSITARVGPTFHPQRYPPHSGDIPDDQNSAPFITDVVSILKDQKLPPMKSFQDPVHQCAALGPVSCQKLANGGDLKNPEIWFRIANSAKTIVRSGMR